MAVPAFPESLAILGGSPCFRSPIHVGRPNLGDYRRFEERMRGIWERNWLTNDGPLVREFEAAVCRMLDVEHCVAVCNATIGLEIAVRALRLTGEVIVPAFTFVASAHCLRWQGLRPVFCDVDPGTHQICPRAAARLITDRTSGILAVHLWGYPAPVAELAELAKSRNLTLLFDSSHAFGSTSGGRWIGSFGAAEVFSFHATKFVNSFEGGCITTNDAALAEKMRLMRNFGFAGYDRVIHLGTNGKMSEPSAAMALTSLENMPACLERNHENFDRYSELLDGIPGITLLQPRPGEISNRQYVVAEVRSDEFGLTRDQLLAVLHAENVLVRRYFYPGCHRMAPYGEEPESTPEPLPHTEALCDRVLQFPTGTSVDAEVIRRIVGIVAKAGELADEIVRRMP